MLLLHGHMPLKRSKLLQLLLLLCQLLIMLLLQGLHSLLLCLHGLLLLKHSKFMQLVCKLFVMLMLQGMHSHLLCLHSFLMLFPLLHVFHLQVLLLLLQLQQPLQVRLITEHLVSDMLIMARIPGRLLCQEIIVSSWEHWERVRDSIQDLSLHLHLCREKRLRERLESLRLELGVCEGCQDLLSGGPQPPLVSSS